MQAIQLPKASLSTLSGHQQQWIACEKGMLWLSDDGHDVILERGQKWQICSDNAVVIEAFADSRFAIQSDQYRATTGLKAAQNQVNEFIHHLLRKPAVKTVNA